MNFRFDVLHGMAANILYEKKNPRSLPNCTSNTNLISTCRINKLNLFELRQGKNIRLAVATFLFFNEESVLIKLLICGVLEFNWYN